MINNLYNKKLKIYARVNRSNGTKAEVRLWCELLRKKQLGYTFNRQRPIGNYIVDFLCKELQLIIEVDGLSHHSEEAARMDVKREKYLQELGFTVVRLDDDEVFMDIVNVQSVLETVISDLNKKKELSNK